jgi:hypothetical protein
LLWQHLSKQKNHIMETNKNLAILFQKFERSFFEAVMVTLMSIFLWPCLVTASLFFGNDYSWGEPVSLIRKIAIVVISILCFLVSFSFWQTAKKHKKIYNSEEGAL